MPDLRGIDLAVAACSKSLFGSLIHAFVGSPGASKFANQVLDRVHVSWKHTHDLILCLEHVFHAEPLDTSAKHALPHWARSSR